MHLDDLSTTARSRLVTLRATLFASTIAALAIGGAVGCGAGSTAGEVRASVNPASPAAGPSGEPDTPDARTNADDPSDDDPSDDGPAPEFSFDNRRHDFGEHWITEKLRHRFEFTNAGDAPLIIERVRPSCASCTASNFSDDPVAPGERGFIEVELRADAEGRRQKYVDVYSNATDTKRPVKLTVIATFRQFFWLDPETVDFGLVEQGGEFPPRRLRISWLAERDLEVRPLAPPADHFELESTPFEEGDRKGFDVTLRVTDAAAAFAGAAGDFFHDNLEIRTNLAGFGLRTVRLTGKIRREVQVRPARQVVEAGIAGKLRFVLAAAPGFGLAVEGVECSIDAWDMRIETKKEGSWYIVHLEPKSGARLEPGNGEVTIRTNYDKQPIFRVPIDVVDPRE